jgi:hypothetical protein
LIVAALVIAACVPGPAGGHMLKGHETCYAPGIRCNYSDDCCSEVCDANECRGPMPGPGGP